MTLLRSDFPATYIATAFDLRDELVQLNKLQRRSSNEVAKQIQVAVDTIYDVVKTTSTVAVAPDGTTPATVVLKQLYVDYTAFDRAVRIKINRLLALSDNTEVRNAVAAQLKYFLEHSGWTFAGVASVASVSTAGVLTGTDGTYAATQASTSGSGSGAVFEVDVVNNEAVAIRITTGGTGYVFGELVVLTVATVLNTIPCVALIGTIL